MWVRLYDEEKAGINRFNKIEDALIQDVIDHINSFPRTESHYHKNRISRTIITYQHGVRAVQREMFG